MKRLGENNLAMIAARVKADYIPKSDTVQAQSLSVDNTPTEGSENLVTSGGVYDSFYKRGVISQTQTWTQAQDGGDDYVMSDLVYGDIPKSNIDLYEAAGATFNATTGYFELNGLTDISYEEMIKIYVGSIGNLALHSSLESLYNQSTLRTVLPFANSTYVGYAPNATNLFMSAAVESIGFPNGIKFYASTAGTFAGAANCRTIIGIINVSNISSPTWNFVYNCLSLEEIFLKGIKGNYSFAHSSRLSLASIVYMINNEAATSAITITLHATAYARAIADTDVQTALQNHPLVTLASA